MESSCRMLSDKFPADISFTALDSISATCKVTNKIDIGKYFDVLKTEYTKIQESPKSKRVVGRSESSGTAEEMFLNSKRKKLPPIKKRISLGNIECLEPQKLHCESLSNHITDINLNDNFLNDFSHSYRNNMDINLNKVKLRMYQDLQIDELVMQHHLQVDELAGSYSEGDLTVFINNNHLSSSKSCESLINLNERHKEHALMYGKLFSVSEENRKLRKKYFNERKSSKEKLQKIEVNQNNIEEEFSEKLSLGS